MGNLEHSTDGVGRLFGSTGPLENLTFDGCDLRPYLDAFLDAPLFPKAIHPNSSPVIKELIIDHPVQSFYDKVYTAAIVGLTRLQHARGLPFERVEFCTKVSSPVVDELTAFVDTLECCEEVPLDGED